MVRNILLTVLNEISNGCGLKLLDVIVKYWKIISSSSEWTLIITMVSSAGDTYFLDCFERCSGSNERIFHIVERFFESVHAILPWTVMIDSSLVGLTVLILIEIIALETILVTHTSSTALRGEVGVIKEFFISLRDFSKRFMRMSSLSSRDASIYWRSKEFELEEEGGGAFAFALTSIHASPFNEKENSNNLIVVLGTSGCLNVDVNLLKNRRWLCGSCLL
nr:hypothetical protein [Tanacetum cinerariifolium]